jgi:hypothetical protein
MINDQLRAVIDRALDRERISAEDVRELQREVFEHGLTCREEVNVLAALDRAVPTADPLWAKFFVASLVEFVVWTSRPTGYVDNETARWLVTALMSMDRATVNAHRAALEIVREAQQVDEELLPLLLMPREIAPSVPMHLAVLQPQRRAKSADPGPARPRLGLTESACKASSSTSGASRMISRVTAPAVFRELVRRAATSHAALSMSIFPAGSEPQMAKSRTVAIR